MQCGWYGSLHSTIITMQCGWYGSLHSTYYYHVPCSVDGIVLCTILLSSCSVDGMVHCTVLLSPCSVDAMVLCTVLLSSCSVDGMVLCSVDGMVLCTVLLSPCSVVFLHSTIITIQWYINYHHAVWMCLCLHDCKSVTYTPTQCSQGIVLACSAEKNGFFMLI